MIISSYMVKAHHVRPTLLLRQNIMLVERAFGLLAFFG